MTASYASIRVSYCFLLLSFAIIIIIIIIIQKEVVPS